MKFIEVDVIGPSYRTLTGVLKLTAEQAQKRKYGLKKKGRQRGVYEVTKLIEFKRGERLEIAEEDLSKVSLQVVKPVEEQDETGGNGNGEPGGNDSGNSQNGEPDLNDPTAEGSLSNDNGDDEDDDEGNADD